MEKLEYRCTQFEVRAAGESIISGYAAVFDQPSLPIEGRYIERIRPGAFSRSLSGDGLLSGDVLALYDHNTGNVLGRTASGSLALAEDRTGLKATIKLPPTQLGNDVYALVKRGDLRGFSFGFRARKDSWSPDHKNRELLDIDLHEISVVSMPSYPQTTVEARGLELRAESIGIYRAAKPSVEIREPAKDDPLEIERLRQLEHLRLARML